MNSGLQNCETYIPGAYAIDFAKVALTNKLSEAGGGPCYHICHLHKFSLPFSTPCPIHSRLSIFAFPLPCPKIRTIFFPMSIFLLLPIASHFPCKQPPSFFSLKFFFINLFLERGREGGRQRETSMCGCLSCSPYWGPGL